MAYTKKQIRRALDELPDWQTPLAYLLGTEHYDVSYEGETRDDWIEEAVEDSGYEPFLVQINTGATHGATVAVLGGHPNEALEQADDWTQTFYYEGDSDAYEEARGAGYGPVDVVHLMEVKQSNPAPCKETRALKNRLLT